MKSLPNVKAKGSSAAQALAYCNLLFAFERDLSGKNDEKRKNRVGG